MANNKPIFSRVGSLSTDNGTGMAQAITAAANDYTGISANYALIFTSDPTFGSFLQGLRLVAAGTNVATVMRFFLNNGSTPGTATNNTFIGEISLPATTAIATTVTAPVLDWPYGRAIDPSFRIYAGLGTAVAAGWVVSALGGGKY